MEIKLYQSNESDLLKRIFEVLDLKEEYRQQLLHPRYTLSENHASCLQAVKERIIQAKKNGEKVFVAGDYDADGVMATTIMKDLLDQLGIENGYYIPDRFKEGYGLNAKIVQMAYDKGYRLIITVDNGVKAFEAIDLAKSLGMDVIVSDHHLYDQELNGVIVVHPDLMEAPFHKMCGAGMALEIAKLFIEDPRHVVFAMIATIGDIMPLWDENRTIVLLGLKLLNQYRFLNICKLIDKKLPYDEVDMAFQLIPKINTIGRLEDESNPNMLVKYFLSKRLEEIDLVKNQINDKNKLRKELSKEMVDRCNALIQEEGFILLESEDFHEGMCGLAAGSIVRSHLRPCVILSKQDNLYKGSGRGIAGFDIHQYLSQYSDLFETFGGHKMAVGLSIYQSQLNQLKEHLKQDQIKIKEEAQWVIPVSVEEISLEVVSKIHQFKPYGEGFRLPLLYMDDFNVSKFQLIKGKYPKWTIEHHQKLEAISFQSDKKIIENPQFMIFEPTINTFNGQQSVSLLVKSVG
ncbi:MAG: DHH family phosphoesterase [Erysipelotrichaceae bacterium]